MAMNPNLQMANMNAMGGPVGAPVPMMNNGAVAPPGAGPRPGNEDRRTLLNTYIYEYFLRSDMYDAARAMVNSDQPMNLAKEGNRRRDENGNILNGLGDDAMDTDSKEGIDSKLPEDLPAPKIPMPSSETSFLFDWFCLFWDIFQAQRSKAGGQAVNQYLAHTQVRIWLLSPLSPRS
jgi:hypothetical protein